MLHTNFEDNLFLLNRILKTTVLIQELHVDFDIFREKLLFDITFLDHGMKTFLTYLEENPQILERSEYLASLLNVEQNFVTLLGTIVHKENEDSDTTEELKHLSTMHDQHLRNIECIEKIISQSNQAEEQEMVTNLELQLLLTEEDDDGKKGKK